MALRYVVLGFLVERPMHGYELKQRLSPAVSRDRQLNDGVLYPLLRALERDGLIRKTVDRTANARPRHVYRPTPAGRRAFAAWLADAAGEGDEIAYDFLLGHPFLHKCLFFRDLPPATVHAKIGGQRGAARAKLREFQRIRTGMLARDVDPYRIAILDLGIAQQRAKIRWLTRLAKQVPLEPAAETARPGPHRKRATS